MKYALLSSVGGEPIQAEEADYEHYKGFLKCPACGKPVFLRKEHNRRGRQICSAFIHHKAIPEVSICELRVGNYSKEDVESLSTKARGQRLARLRVSLWKYIKTNMAIDLSRWSHYKREIDNSAVGQTLVNYTEEFMDINKDFVLQETLEKCQNIFINSHDLIGIESGAQKFFEPFIEKNRYRWELHYKITKEMLDSFLKNPDFEMIRHRLYCCLCHPDLFWRMPGLIDKDIRSEEFLETFGAYLTLEITFVFLTIDWIEIFKK